MATIQGSRALELSTATPRTIQVDLPNNLNLNADSIINGTLSAGRIATGSITASKLNVSTLSAITANLGSVTAGNITGSSNITISGNARFNGVDLFNTFTYAGQFNTSSNADAGIYCVGSPAVNGFSDSNGIGVQGISGGTGTGVYGFNVLGTGAGVTGLASGVNGSGVEATNNAGGFALRVFGKMSMSSQTLVTNLNAQLHGGKPVDQLCSIIVTNNGTATVGGNGFVLTSTVAGTRVSAPSGNSVVIESTSDRRLKQDIYPEKLGLDFINSLLPVEYKLKSNTDLKYHGFIADDIEKLISEDDRDSLFQVHSDGIKGSDYMSLIAPIVKSIQELTEQIKEIKERLNNG